MLLHGLRILVLLLVWSAWATGSAQTLPAGGAATTGGADVPCDVSFTVTPNPTRQPRVLEVTLGFDPGERRQTELQFTESWASAPKLAAAIGAWRTDDDAVKLSPLAEAHRWQVDHPPGQRVRLHYEVRADLADPDEDKPQGSSALYSAQLGGDWFQFFGYAVFPTVLPHDDDSRLDMCLTLAQPGQPEAPAFSSHGAGRGTVTMRVRGSPMLLRHAWYAGGPGWRVSKRVVAGGQLTTAVRGRFAFDDDALADAAARLIGVHRRFWGDTQADPQWLVLTPNFSPRNRTGTLVHQTAVLHAGPDFSPADGGLDTLVGHENLHLWFPQRFGEHRRVKQPAEAVRDYWFSEGFTNYYSHRLLLEAGLWDLPRYARELTQLLRRHWQSPAREVPVDAIGPRFFSDRDAGQQLYSRGELLAMRWDRALRTQGHPGLDGALRALMRPPAEAGSPPPAADRVLDGLVPWLGELPRRDVEAHIARGRLLVLDEDIAGPCFSLQWAQVPRWVLGFDQATSIAARQLSGVLPRGPAHAAGLRDGMPLLGWSIYGGDVEREVELTLGPKESLRTVRYRPVDGRAQRLPTLVVRPGAEEAPACLAWRFRAAPRG